MSDPFFDHPILNSPYEYPLRHWELDEGGQPTQKIIGRRRSAKFITPIPKPKKRKAATPQPGFVLMKARGFRAENSNTIPPQSSMKCARGWMLGAHCPRISGRSPRGRLASLSTGGTISSVAFARFSARWRRWKPLSGSPKSRLNPGTESAFWTIWFQPTKMPIPN
jgi:hypothetical protein